MKIDYPDPKQLEAFIAVISIGSMTGAAKVLGRSQSVITRLIQDLETSLGYALLDRNGPRFTPTDRGVAFYQHAEIILSGLRSIAEGGRLIGGNVQRTLEIATIPSLATSVVAAALAKLDDRLPDLVHVHTMASENVVQAVLSRSTDLGFASYPLDNLGIDILHDINTRCVAALHPDHPLANKACFEIADIVRERLIVSANPYRLRMSVDRILNERGLRPAQIISSNASYVSLSMVQQGLGVAIIEGLTPRGLRMPDVKILPLDVDIHFRWAIISAIGRPLSELSQRIIAEAVKGVP